MLVLALASCRSLAPAPVVTSTWVRVWNDEFEGPAGARVDSLNWTYDIGDGCRAAVCGWGNAEKESYTAATENVSLNGNGQLAIVARVAPATLACRTGPCRYTSARIKTMGRMNVQPGRVEARIRIPSGQGLWPAFWMLGAGYPATPWPRAGELDIMENHGSHPRSTSSAMHGPGYSGSATPFVHAFALPSGRFSDDFHRFSVQWDSTRVQFFVDDVLHYIATRADVEGSGPWVFDQPFYILLNLAVGGHFDGDPKSDDILPATMLVDYVRVYAPAGARRRSSDAP